MIRRRRLKLQWFLIVLLAVFVSVTVLVNNVELGRQHKHKSWVSNRIPKKALLSVNNQNVTEFSRRRISTVDPKKKHTTKSMKELAKMDDVNKHFLFLNSVPKSGSEILIFLLEKIQGFNNFKHVRLKGGNKRKLNKIQQEEMIDEIYDIRRNMATPLSFDRSVYFVNFTAFDKQLPTYINLIRHPVAKVMARASSKKTGTFDRHFTSCLLENNLHCNFKNGKPYDLTIPYFCGQDPRCLLLNSDWAFKSAVLNVQKYYKVVGVLEELNKSLDALENHIPQFFKGAKETFQMHLLDMYKNKKEPDVPLHIQKVLEKTLGKELEFYTWIKDRLLKTT